jgi:hypothetical protein
MEHIIVLFISLEKWNENEVNVAILDMVWNIMHLATLGMVWKWSLVSSHTTQIATQTVFTFFIFINSKANRNISLSLLLVFFSKVAIHHKTMAIQSQSPLLLSWFLTPSLVASLVLAWSPYARVIGLSLTHPTLCQIEQQMVAWKYNITLLLLRTSL